MSLRTSRPLEAKGAHVHAREQDRGVARASPCGARIDTVLRIGHMHTTMVGVPGLVMDRNEVDKLRAKAQSIARKRLQKEVLEAMYLLQVRDEFARWSLTGGLKTVEASLKAREDIMLKDDEKVYRLWERFTDARSNYKNAEHEWNRQNDAYETLRRIKSECMRKHETDCEYHMHSAIVKHEKMTKLDNEYFECKNNASSAEKKLHCEERRKNRIEEYKRDERDKIADHKKARENRRLELEKKHGSERGCEPECEERVDDDLKAYVAEYEEERNTKMKADFTEHNEFALKKAKEAKDEAEHEFNEVRRELYDALEIVPSESTWPNIQQFARSLWQGLWT